MSVIPHLLLDCGQVLEKDQTRYRLSPELLGRFVDDYLRLEAHQQIASSWLFLPKNVIYKSGENMAGTPSDLQVM